MNRSRVFLLRLAASVVLLTLVFAVVRLFWYPGAYLTILGAGRQLLVLALVVLVVGPVLSTFVYKVGKKGLALDLGILAGIELLAVSAAVGALYQRQPHFTVFAVDRFEVVSHGEVDSAALPPGVDGSRPGHSPRLVFARMPKDPEIVSRLIDETVLMGLPDIDRRPEFWQPYTDGIPVIKAAAAPFETLLQQGGEERRATARDWLSARGGDAADYVFLPLRGRSGDAALILDADIGFPVATLQVDPW